MLTETAAKRTDHPDISSEEAVSIYEKWGELHPDMFDSTAMYWQARYALEDSIRGDEFDRAYRRDPAGYDPELESEEKLAKREENRIRARAEWNARQELMRQLVLAAAPEIPDEQAPSVLQHAWAKVLEEHDEGGYGAEPDRDRIKPRERKRGWDRGL